jgi:CAAX protease family protein
VLGALRRALHRHTAVVVSALFFAAAHLQVVELLPILILGLVLGYLYEITGSLVPGMIAHGLNNLAALFVFYQGPSIGS